MRPKASSEDMMLEAFHAASLQPATDEIAVLAAGDRRQRPGDDPRRAMRSVFRRWRLLLLMTIAGAALGWLSVGIAEEADTMPIEVDHYQASHVLVLDGNVPDTQTVLSVRNLNTLAKRITVGELPLRVADLVGLTPTEAATQVRVIIRSDSESVDIITVGETPSVAEQLADVYAAELFDYLHDEAEAYAEESVASAQARLDEAESNLARVRADLESARAADDARRIGLLEQDEQQYLSARIYANASLLDARADGVPLVPLETLQSASGRATVISSSRFDELVDRAAVGQNIEILFGDEPESGSSGGALAAVSSRLPNGALPRLAAGAIMGLIVGLMLALFLNRVDNRVRSKRQIEDLLDLPVVAEVPTVGRNHDKRPALIARDNPRSRFAEQYRGLASTIGYAGRTRPDRPTQVVLVTSPGPAEGKTTTVANLGVVLAETGAQVLLVNCDFRRPRLHQHLGTDDVAMELHQTSLPGVDVVTNVVEDLDAPPTEVVAAQLRIVEQAQGRYDVVVIDTAPLLATNDAVDLLDLVDDVILVIRAGKTTLQAADRAVETLERRRAHVLGIAITGVDSRTAEDYYYYGSYYYDGSRGPRGPQRRRRFGRRRRSEEEVVDIVDGDDTVDLATGEQLTAEPVAAAAGAVASSRAPGSEAVAIGAVQFDDIVSELESVGPFSLGSPRPAEAATPADTVRDGELPPPVPTPAPRRRLWGRRRRRNAESEER